MTTRFSVAFFSHSFFNFIIIGIRECTKQHTWANRYVLLWCWLQFIRCERSEPEYRKWVSNWLLEMETRFFWWGVVNWRLLTRQKKLDKKVQPMPIGIRIITSDLKINSVCTLPQHTSWFRLTKPAQRKTKNGSCIGCANESLVFSVFSILDSVLTLIL